MVQVLDKDKENQYNIILKEIIILEELPMEQENQEKIADSKREKHKKALKKLLNKAKYNANYLKDVKPIEDIKNRINVRSRAVY
jgi:hypothetical protein